MFFKYKQDKLNIKYNLSSIFSLLTYDRVLNPGSKKAAYDTKDSYFEEFNFSLKDTYRALDYFNNYSSELQTHLNKKVEELYGRPNQIGYYDVTNYYFEIPYEDQDIIDDNGNILKKGSRKRGPSKENKKDPIIQMGLLMDSRGLPMTFNTFEGNESEKLSLLPTIRTAKNNFNLQRIIVVADRGLNTSDNTTFLSGKNDDDNQLDGYVFGQSVLGADKEFKEWVLDPKGYISDKEKDKNDKEVTFTHKSRIFAKTVTLKSTVTGNRSKKMEIYQKQMVYYSQKYADKQKKERAILIAKAKDLIANSGKYTRATSYGATGYINNIKFVKSTGEIPDGLQLSLKLDKIEEEAKYDGYYSIVTSEKNLSDKEIRDVYKGLWEIEESFRIMKNEFNARPAFLQKREHIDAHFLVCFVALLIFRILEMKTKHKFSVSQLRETLIKYSCSHASSNSYLFDFRNNVIEELESIFDLDLRDKYMTKLKIKKILQIK